VKHNKAFKRITRPQSKLLQQIQAIQKELATHEKELYLLTLQKNVEEESANKKRKIAATETVLQDLLVKAHHTGLNTSDVPRVHELLTTKYPDLITQEGAQR
jgi:hypothetical protein